MARNCRKEVALTALLSARSVREASQCSGISERTFYRFLQNKAFVSEYRAARRALVETAIAKAQTATAEAVDTLIRNLHCEQPTVELRAAQVLLDTAIRGVESIDILERVEELERREGEG